MPNGLEGLRPESCFKSLDNKLNSPTLIFNADFSQMNMSPNQSKLEWYGLKHMETGFNYHSIVAGFRQR